MKIIHIDKNDEHKQIIKLTLNGSISKYIELNNITEIRETADLIILNSENLIADIEKLKKTSITKDVPIVVISQNNSPITKVRAFDLDVFDFINSPFDSLELTSRIRSVMRKINRNDTKKQLSYENIILNIDNHTVSVDQKNIELTAKEFLILYILLKNKNVVVSKEKLFSEVWNTDKLQKSRTLDMHITTLRQKLGVAGDYIKTIRSIGYII